jgi:2,3-bisphosphoglycerate-independent phosphoglycerate mutase
MNWKSVIFLGDGMADEPVAVLGGKTPLEAARKPHMDRIAREGRCGLLHTVTDPAVPAGSDAANLAVMGYNVREVIQGRGVLEAASMGVEIGPEAMAMRMNLIFMEDGRIKNHSAGHISTEEADAIIATLNERLGGDGIAFHTGVSYRHLMVGQGLDPALECAAPHDHPGEAVEPLMMRAKNGATAEALATAERLNGLTRASWDLLAAHPVNAARRAAGKDPATSIWLWSPGRRPKMATFAERFGVTGAVISAVDLIRGIGAYAGLELLHVEGATGLWDTNYEGKADKCLEALERVDFVFVHVEAPDEAGHEGDAALKVRTIEDLDARLIGRVMAGLEKKGIAARLAVLPDHPTPVEKRVHTRAAVPFAIAGPGVAADGVERYDEKSCAAGGYGELRGDGFIREALGRSVECGVRNAES